MRNINKKLLGVLVVFLLLSVSIPSLSGKISRKTDLDLPLDQLLSSEEMIFKLKMRVAMKLAHMKSVSACIIKNNTIVWSDNFDFSDRLTREKPTINTNYMAGSISKVVTAAAIMQLYENESYTFDLDDNVSQWLPFDIKNPNHPAINITFRMLLSHQSSIMGHGFSEIKYLFSNNKDTFLEEILMPNGSEYHPDYWGSYKPGEEANYSNMGFILLGYLIERMTNQSYEEYVHNNILEPLEMHNTSFNMSKIDKDNLATPYYWLGGMYFRVPKTDYTFIDPAGGMYTTVEDLSHLLIMHLNGGIYNDKRILKNSTIEMMHTIHYPNSSLCYGLRFGLGWLFKQDENDNPILQGHGGDLICYHARMWSRTSDNTSYIFFYNSGNFVVPRILLPIISLIIKQIGDQQVKNLLFQKADEL